MREGNNKQRHCPAAVRLSVGATAIMFLAAGTAAAQDPRLAGLQLVPGTTGSLLGSFSDQLSSSAISSAATAQSTRWQWSGAPIIGFAASPDSTGTNQARSDGIPRRISLEQVKQQALANPAANPLARLGQLSIEAAKQHRLGVQADYFPKISATATNLHFSSFLGEVLTIQHPVSGAPFSQALLPLLAQNQTLVAVTFMQPITPIFEVYQLVRIARADERTAMAKAGVAVSRNAPESQIEEAYFRLLIARRRLTSAELKLRNTEARPQYASASIELARTRIQEPELAEDRKALVTVSAEVRELTARLNRVMGWPDDTELELVAPDPLVENVSLRDVADTPVAGNPEVVEAEQNAVKARAASVLSKLAYVPTVAAVSGFIYQNAIPVLPNTFGYGGVMASWNLFDFGKRERAVKEASAQLEMAEIAVQLTKAKVAANVKAAYSELERTRQLSQITQKMGSSVTRLMTVSSTSESMDMIAARASVEAEMLDADLAHRQAYARLKALTGC